MTHRDGKHSATASDDVLYSFEVRVKSIKKMPQSKHVPEQEIREKDDFEPMEKNTKQVYNKTENSKGHGDCEFKSTTKYFIVSDNLHPYVKEPMA